MQTVSGTGPARPDCLWDWPGAARLSLGPDRRDQTVSGTGPAHQTVSGIGPARPDCLWDRTSAPDCLWDRTGAARLSLGPDQRDQTVSGTGPAHQTVSGTGPAHQTVSGTGPARPDCLWDWPGAARLSLGLARRGAAPPAEKWARAGPMVSGHHGAAVPSAATRNNAPFLSPACVAPNMFTSVTAAAAGGDPAALSPQSRRQCGLTRRARWRPAALYR